MVERKRINKIDLFEYGKIPPQETEIEAYVLGSIILESKAMNVSIRHLVADDFYLESHKAIYGAMIAMYQNGETIDMLTLIHKLKKMEILESCGGPFYISKLCERIGSTYNLEAYIQIITDASKRRKLIEIGHNVNQAAYDVSNNVEELINSSSLELMRVNKNLFVEQEIREISLKNLEKIELIRSGKIKRYGISTNIQNLDNIINGLISPDLLIVAARPGMGKTAFAITIAVNVAIYQRKPVGIFSLEMSAEQLEIRMKSLLSNVNGSKITRGNITDEEMQGIEEATGHISKSPVFIDDQASLNIMTIRSKAIEWKTTKNIQLIIVDYLQLISAPSGSRRDNREGEVSEISRGLKQLAKELDVPIIALSQLNRECEKRNPPEPRLFDLRESGSIEQDADIVLMLYRPEAYKIETIDVNGVLTDSKNICILKVEKHRNGATGRTALRTNLGTSYFADYGENTGPNMDIFIEPVTDAPF